MDIKLHYFMLNIGDIAVDGNSYRYTFNTKSDYVRRNLQNHVSRMSYLDQLCDRLYELSQTDPVFSDRHLVVDFNHYDRHLVKDVHRSAGDLYALEMQHSGTMNKLFYAANPLFSLLAGCVSGMCVAGVVRSLMPESAEYSTQLPNLLGWMGGVATAIAVFRLGNIARHRHVAAIEKRARLYFWIKHSIGDYLAKTQGIPSGTDRPAISTSSDGEN